MDNTNINKIIEICNNTVKDIERELNDGKEKSEGYLKYLTETKETVLRMLFWAKKNDENKQLENS